MIQILRINRQISYPVDILDYRR